MKRLLSKSAKRKRERERERERERVLQRMSDMKQKAKPE